MNRISLLIALFVLSGCDAVPINPGAKHVKLTNTEPGKECQLLGEATGDQGNFLTGGWTSNSNLDLGARNDLKNKAAVMGGNVVVILTHRAGQTGSAGDSQQTNVTITGNVYRCAE